MKRKREISEILHRFDHHILINVFPFFAIYSLTIELNEKSISYSDSLSKNVSTNAFLQIFRSPFVTLIETSLSLNINIEKKKIDKKN